MGRRRASWGASAGRNRQSVRLLTRSRTTTTIAPQRFARCCSGTSCSSGGFLGERPRRDRGRDLSDLSACCDADHVQPGGTGDQMERNRWARRSWRRLVRPERCASTPGDFTSTGWRDRAAVANGRGDRCRRRTGSLWIAVRPCARPRVTRVPDHQATELARASGDDRGGDRRDGERPAGHHAVLVRGALRGQRRLSGCGVPRCAPPQELSTAARRAARQAAARAAGRGEA